MKTGILRLLARQLYLVAATSYLFVSVLLYTPRVAAVGATLYIDTNANSTTENILSANIRLNADTGQVSSVQFGLAYDTAKLEFLSGESSGSPLTNPTASAANGNVSVAAGSSSDKVTGDVPITNLKFRILVRSGSTALTFTNPRVYNVNNSEIASWAAGATYNFGEATTPTSPGPSAPTVTPTTPVATASPRPTVTAANKTSMPVTNSPAAPSDNPPKTAPTTDATAPSVQTENLFRSGSVFLKPDAQAAKNVKFPLLQWILGGVISAVLATTLFIYATRFWRKSMFLDKAFALKSVTTTALPTVEIVPESSQSEPIPGSIVTWSNPERQYEVIRPLRTLPTEGELTPATNPNSPQVSLPHIPVTETQNEQAIETGEKTSEWMYDINSPLMNTL